MFLNKKKNPADFCSSTHSPGTRRQHVYRGTSILHLYKFCLTPPGEAHSLLSFGKTDLFSPPEKKRLAEHMKELAASRNNDLAEYAAEATTYQRKHEFGDVDAQLEKHVGSKKNQTINEIDADLGVYKVKDVLPPGLRQRIAEEVENAAQTGWAKKKHHA